MRATLPGPIRRTSRWARRHPLPALNATLLLVILVTGVRLSFGWLSEAQGSARRARQTAAELELALREERASLERYEEVAGPAVARDLVRLAEGLWPRRERMLPRLDSWLARAEEVLARAGQDEEAPFAELRRVAREVAAHRRFAALVRRRTVLEEKEAWEACRTSLRADARFAGFDVDRLPIVGLVPLGRDADSGFWEFWHVESGARPRWEGSRAAGKVVIEEASGFVLVLLPGGEYLMGAQSESAGRPRFDPAATAAERAVHAVEVPPFLISKYELTRAQQRRLIGFNPDRLSDGDQKARRAITGRDAAALVQGARVENALARWELHLCTEAQWEYAARGGAPHPRWTGADVAAMNGKVNLADRTAAYRIPQADRAYDDGFAAEAPVGSLPPNPYGLHEVLGNLWELCRDDYRGYPDSESGVRSASLPLRVMRGGGYLNPPSGIRVSARAGLPYGEEATYGTIRPVREIPPQP